MKRVILVLALMIAALASAGGVPARAQTPGTLLSPSDVDPALTAALGGYALQLGYAYDGDCALAAPAGGELCSQVYRQDDGSVVVALLDQSGAAVALAPVTWRYDGTWAIGVPSSTVVATGGPPAAAPVAPAPLPSSPPSARAAAPAGFDTLPPSGAASAGNQVPPATAASLPPCVDGHYGVDVAGTGCQVRGETTPTALCRDGSFDYSRSFYACSAHGGILSWVQPSGAVQTGPVFSPPPASATATPPNGSSALAPVQTAPAGALAVHIWYTSDESTARYYYCDDDAEWRSLSPAHLRSYATVSTLVAIFPGRVLHLPCRDGATGP